MTIFFTRREVLRPTLAGWLLIILIGVAIVLAFASGIYPFLAQNAPLGADVMVVEGWVDDEQIAKVVDLYHSGGYSHLCATGLPIMHGSELLPFSNYAEMTRMRLLAAGVPPEKVLLAVAPNVRRNRTRAMALALKGALQQSAIDAESVDIFSVGPHARRSRDTYRVVLSPEYEVGVIAATPSDYDRSDWYRCSEGFKSVLSESVAYAYNLPWILMNDHVVNIAVIYFIVSVLGYLLGAVPFGFLIGKAKGVDVRRVGSGNIGATNVFRTVGRNWGIVALVLDFMKGLLAAYLIPTLVVRTFSVPAPYLIGLASGCAAVVGHSYSIYLKLRGGKGIATSAGMLAGVVPVPFIIGVGVWILIFVVFHYVSLASIVAAFSVAFAAWICTSCEGLTLPIVITALALLVILRHHSNLKRLFAGTESRVSFRKADRS